MLVNLRNRDLIVVKYSNKKDILMLISIHADEAALFQCVAHMPPLQNQSAYSSIINIWDGWTLLTKYYSPIVQL